MSKEKMEVLEELMKNKVAQANALKDSMRPIEAYGASTKELCKKINEIIQPKKIESLEMLSKGKVHGEAYKYLSEILSAISSVTESAEQDAEKIHFAKQQELNFIINEYTKLKEIHGKMVSELNKTMIESQVEEKQAQDPQQTVYVRPDQNPNTKLGRAAMDLQKRRNNKPSVATVNEN